MFKLLSSQLNWRSLNLSNGKIKISEWYNSFRENWYIITITIFEYTKEYSMLKWKEKGIRNFCFIKTSCKINWYFEFRYEFSDIRSIYNVIGWFKLKIRIINLQYS